MFTRTRIAAIAALALAAVLVTAGAASAHVKVSGIDVTQGGYGVITFRVPSESATLSTTQIAITFPSDTPIVSVSTQPKAGWTSVVTTDKLATPITTDDGQIDSYVSKVTFTADSASTAIPPQEFELFNLSVGPLPKVSQLSFPTLQSYSDGSTVNWNEKSADGTTEPQHPAPTLALPKAASSDSSTASTSGETATTSTPVAPAPSNSADWTGIVGLVAGVLALIVSLIAIARSTRPAAARDSATTTTQP